MLSGITYLITRRCAQRTFRLRPHPQTNHAFEYCLALAAQKTGVLIHAVVVMSNHHHHLVVTDVRGELPNFLRELHRSTAKVINASQGQWENLWAAEQASAVALANDEDVIDKLAYLVANPVNAGLVKTPSEWPGSIHWQPGTTRTLAKPKRYFSASSPEAATLTLTPVAYEFLSREQAAGLFDNSLAEKLRVARRAVRQSELKFLGRDRVMAQSFQRRAHSYEVKRYINPRFAAKHGPTRCVMIRIWRRFSRQYRAALAAWRAGNRSVQFPIGTWGICRMHGACVVAET